MATELYNHLNDELETNNLSQTAEYVPIVKILSKKLKEGRKAALPPEIENNSNNPIAPPHVSWSPEAKKKVQNNK